MSVTMETSTNEDQMNQRSNCATEGTEEKIFMIPKCKTEKSTTIIIEKRRVDRVESSNVHVAGGNHSGLIIQKDMGSCGSYGECDISLQFKVFLISSKDKKHRVESRTLRFWFKSYFEKSKYPNSSQEFFKLLVSPTDFPKDYVGFIMKAMKLLQNGNCVEIQMIELELSQIDESDTTIERPTHPNGLLITLNKYPTSCTNNINSIKMNKIMTPPPKIVQTHHLLNLKRKMSENEVRVEMSESKVLEMIESAYPNPLSLPDITKQGSCSGSEESGGGEILNLLSILQSKGLIKEIQPNVYTRVVQNEGSVKIVNQMPAINKRKQPTIALITASYAEKLAVDAMMGEKETFVRYTTVGESNVYTLGTLGHHRVVSTKLPTVGHAREAMIAAGNTTTRLLGTFQKVDFVFLVGVGGGVPHFTDFEKHVRLGDIVVSAPTTPGKAVYMYCEKSESSGGDETNVSVKSWTPAVFTLQNIATSLVSNCDEEWEKYYEEGMSRLKEQETDFSRPPPSSDKLYMPIGERDVIEVAHPPPPPHFTPNRLHSRIHLGCVGGGRWVSRDDGLRERVSEEWGIRAFDSEFDPVLDSIIGNCRDSFILIRGIADYKDGTRRKDWQPHAALLAASFTKLIINHMDPPTDD